MDELKEVPAQAGRVPLARLTTTKLWLTFLGGLLLYGAGAVIGGIVSDSRTWPLVALVFALAANAVRGTSVFGLMALSPVRWLTFILFTVGMGFGLWPTLLWEGIGRSLVGVVVACAVAAAAFDVHVEPRKERPSEL